MTVGEFAYQENAVVAKGGDADIDFRGGVTGFLCEEIADGSGIGERGAGGHHFRGDCADLFVALNVEFVLAIGKTGLRYGLEATCPSEPGWEGHKRIVAVEGRGNKFSASIPWEREAGQKDRSPGRNPGFVWFRVRS